jgi:hypothetical protein
MVVLAILMAVGNFDFLTLKQAAQGDEAMASVRVEFDETILKADGETERMPHSFLPLTLALIALWSAAIIFMFKNRIRQMSLLRIQFALIFILIGLMIHRGWMTDYFESDHQMQIGVYIGLPVVLAILNLLALKGVMADEKLVRSMDRIR